MSVASFSLDASTFKAIVAAYSAANSDYYWHFAADGVKFKAMNPSHVSMIQGEIYPNNYRLNGEPFWVHPIGGANIEQLKTALRSAKKGEEIRCEVKEGKMYVGVPPTSMTVGEVGPLELQDTFDPPIPKVGEDVRLRLALNEFRRIVKAAKDQKTREYSPSPVFESVAFNIEESEGRIIFFNEQKSIVKLDRGLEWLLEMRGRGFAAYGLAVFANYLVPGLSDVVSIDYGVQGIVRISYEAHDSLSRYIIYYWIAPKTMEKNDVDKLLEEKPVTRKLLFRLSDVKSFSSVFAAMNSIATASEFSMGMLDDLWLYWMEGSTGYLMIPKRGFELWEAPENRVSGVFSFKDFIGWFKDVERLECFLETEPEEAMIVAASGSKMAPREIRNNSLQHTIMVPNVKGTITFRGSGSIMSDVMDDGEAAEESFLVLVSTPFEISVVGRDRTYYRASLPFDSFQLVEEDHVVVVKSWFKPLKDCFRHFDVVSFGKNGSNIFLDAENPIGELKALLGQYETSTEYVDAERTYKEEFLKPPTAPKEVKPLTPPKEEVTVFGPNEVKVIEQLVENAKYWQSNMAKRMTVEKYAKEKKGVPDPTAIVDQLIRRGVVYTPKPGYVGLTEPEKYGLPPIGTPYLEEKEIAQRAREEINRALGIPPAPPKPTKMVLYNPTNGDVVEVDLSKTADEKEIVILWSLARTDLKESEKEMLRKTGKIGAYPDEYFEVPRGEWTTERMNKHKRQIEAFEITNNPNRAEKFTWKDKNGNVLDRIHLPFVSGPIVDIINKESEEEALKELKEIMSDFAAKSSWNRRDFQEVLDRHVRRLIRSVKEEKGILPPEEIPLPVEKPEITSTAEDALKELEGL